MQVPRVVSPVPVDESGHPERNILLQEMVDPVKRDEELQSAAASGDCAQVFLN